MLYNQLLFSLFLDDFNIPHAAEAELGVMLFLIQVKGVMQNSQE
jgi:hypothetical protein